MIKPLVLTFGILIITKATGAELADLINPLIGTDGSSETEYGGTMPLVEPPFAMTSWTPQTRQNKISRTSYKYSDRCISGFMGTHQPAIWMGDFGYITLMPEVDSIKTTPVARQLPFSHSNETAKAYCYSVLMDAGGARTIKAEITATDHCAMMQFTYPQNRNASLVVEATRPGTKGFIAVDPAAQEIIGYNPDRMDAHLTSLQLPNFKGYFAVQIHKPFTKFGTYLGSNQQAGKAAASGDNAGAYASFSTQKNEKVLIRIGTSFISINQARANLEAEIPQWNFGDIRSNLRKVWNQELNQVLIQGGSDDQIIQLYSAMYQSLLYPRLFSEYGRYYSAFRR